MKRPIAILFVEFKHKKEFIFAAQKLGYKTILVTEKNKAPSGLFDNTFEIPFHDGDRIDSLCQDLKSRYILKSVLTNYDEFVVQRSYFSEKLNIPAPSLYSACCTRNKVMQRHCFNFLKENIPNRLVKSQKAAFRAFRSLGSDVYMKSISGVKSQFVSHITTEEELNDAYETFQKADLSLSKNLYEDFTFFNLQFHYPDPKKTILLEKSVYGHQISVASFFGSSDVKHAPSVVDIYTAKDIGRDDSFLAFRILPSKHSGDFIQKAHNLSEISGKVLGLPNTAVHSEFLITETGDLKIIEINARMGGYRALMYEEAFGIDLPQLFIKSVTNKSYSLQKKKPKQYVSLVEIFPSNDGILESIEGISLLKNDPEVVHIREQGKKGDSVGKGKNGFRPVLVFLVTGKTYQEVYEKSLHYQKELKIILSP